MSLTDHRLWPAPTGTYAIGGGHIGFTRLTLSGRDDLVHCAQLALGPLAGRLDEPGTMPLAMQLDRGRAAESFELRVDATGVRLRVGDAAGAGYGAIALRNLLPAEAWRSVSLGPWELPYATICDAPRFGWRGAHFDPVRHFRTKAEVLRFIDQMFAHRLNRLHFHLTDDQGWRIGLDRFPQLEEMAAARPETFLGNEFKTDDGGPYGDGTPHGGIYSPGDLREITAYARERGIVIVPEVDLPGHSTALLAAIRELRVPELVNRDELFPAPSTHWGVHRNLISPLPDAFELLGELLGEVCDVIDSPYLHVGGDECELGQWEASAAVAAYCREQGLGTMTQLRADVDRRLCELATSLGRRPMVWDEAFVSRGLPAEAIVQIWRSRHLIEHVTEAGYDCVLSPASKTYIDHPESNDQDEPLSIGGMLPSSVISAWAPARDAESEHVLGVQAQLWSEYLPNVRALDYAAFPRLSLIAAAAWTGDEVPCDAAFEAQLARLDAMGVEYRPPAGPHPWQRGGTGARAAADPDIPLPCDMDLWRLLPWIEREEEK